MTVAVGREGMLRAATFLLSGVFIISIQDVIIKWISGDYPVHEIVLIRSLSGIIPLLLLAHFTGGLKLLLTRRPGIHAFRALLMFGSYTTFYLALAALPLAESVALFFSAPLFIAVLSAFLLEERVDAGSWFSVVAGLAGVILMLKPNVGNFNPAGLLAVLSAFCYALGSIITRKMGGTENGTALAFYPTVLYILYAAVSGLVLSTGSFGRFSHPSMRFLLQDWRVPSVPDLLWLVLLGSMMAMAFYCLSQAYRSAHPAAIAPLEYVAVPLSVFWGYVVWGEVLDLQSVAAVVIIVASGLYIIGRDALAGARVLVSAFRIKIRR